MQKSFLMRFPAGGVNQSVNASLLPPDKVRHAVNCVIEDSMIGCRPGVVLHDLGLTADDAIQGAVFFNPSEGQSQQVFGMDESSLILAAGGKKFKVTLDDKHPYNSKPTVLNITNGLETNPTYHLVWMIQAERYLIAQDGNGETWIWDGQSDPFFSAGYNTTNKEESKLANAASTLAYAHGRVVQCVGTNRIIVGDIIHKTSLSDPSNILDTTEQVYWATGSFFSPPSGLGPVQAMSILPLQNTQHGHGDLIIHCRNGVYSLDISVYPREEWINRAITRHVLVDTGASGFYAIVNYDGDQIFLSRHGIQSLRSEASVNRLGNAFEPISEPMREFTEAENHRMLHFASMTKSTVRRRLFSTVSHMISGRARGGRGMMVLNFQPVADAQFYSWEGVWTLPPEGYLVGNLVRGIFSNTERVFAFVTGTDGIPRLAEFSEDLPYDVLPDGTLKQIEWQVMTRADVLGDETSYKDISNGVVTFRSVAGPVEFEVFCRTEKTGWESWSTGRLSPGSECVISPNSLKDYRFDLGAPPADCRKSLWFQVLVKAKGPAFIESIRVSSSKDNGGENRPSGDGCVLLADIPNCDLTFNPFEYSQ